MDLRRRKIQYIEGEQIPALDYARGTVESYAREVAKAAQWSIGTPLEPIVNLFGGRVHYVDMATALEFHNGAIYVHGHGDFDIVLPQFTSPLRDRFTIGHELGHYFLHSRQGEKAIVAYRQGTGRLEWEANWFAAALLMPKDVFEKALRETKDIDEIAARFGVSASAAEVRQKSLAGG